MTRKTTRDKLRAVFLSALLVVSVFGGTVAFAGTAAANTQSLSYGSAGNIAISQDEAVQTVSFDIAIDSGNSDTVTVDLSAATDDGAAITDIGDAEAGNSEKVSVTDGATEAAGNTAQVTLEDGGSEGATEISFAVTYDTSGVTTTGPVTYDISSENSDESDSSEFNFVDETAPSLSDVTVRDDEGDDTVTDGDTLYVSANVTDNSEDGIDSVTADLSAFSLSESESLSTSNDETYNGTFQIPSDGSGVTADYGSTSVDVAATDSNGNSATESDSVTYTHLSITSPTASSATHKQSSESLSVEMEAASEVSSVDVILANNSGTQKAQRDVAPGTVTFDDLSSLANGTYNVNVDAYDSDGAQIEDRMQEFNALHIDDIAPSTASVDDVNPSSAIAPGTDVEATVSSGDDDSGVESVEVKLTQDDEPFTSSEADAGDEQAVTLDTEGLDSGTYNVTVTVTDKAGNKKTGLSEDAVTIDATPPQNVSVDSPNETQYKRTGGDLTVDYSLDESNLDSVEIIVGDGEGNNLTFSDADAGDGENTETLTLNNDSAEVSGVGVTDGSYSVTVNATDSLGNSASATATDVVEIDDVAPGDIDIESPNGEVITDSEDVLDVGYNYYENNTESVTVTLSGPADYSYSIDDSQYLDDNNRKSLTIDLSETADDGNLVDGNLEDGAYSVEVTVEDSSGNTNSTETPEQYVVIDDDEPAISGVSVDPSSDVAPDATVDVNYTYSDATNATTVGVFIVDAEDEDNFTSGDYENATFSTVEEDVDHASGDETVAVDLTEIVADNEDYTVFVGAIDESDHTYIHMAGGADLNVNAEKPSIDSVEANAGEDTVTVDFSEDVVAGDGDASLDVTDFAYQDINDAGASAITSVERIDGDTVELTLDDDVTLNGLGNDTVSARDGQIVDTDGNNAREVDSGVNSVLADTTGPSAPSIDAGPVNANNDESYGPVTVNVGDEVVDVTLTVSDGSSSVEVSRDSVEDSVDFGGLNVSTLNDTDNLQLTATVTDASGGEASETDTVEKDIVSPYVTSAETNAGTDEVTVTLSEPVSGATFDGENISVARDGDGTESTTYMLDTDTVVQPDDLNNTSVQINAASGTDSVGNGVDDSVSVNLTDGDVPRFVVGSALTSNGSNEVTVQFTEQVFNASGDDLTTANFTYKTIEDDEPVAVDKIESVDYNEETLSATLTLTEDVTSDALNSDFIRSDAVDSEGKEITNAVVLQTGFVVYDEEVTSDGQTVTVSFEADEEVDSLSVDLESRTQLDEVENLDATLDASDFEETDNGDGTYTYEATYEVPRDGHYDVSADDINAVGGAPAYAHFGSTTVDAEDPTPVDAEIVSYDGDSTEIDVQFSEPVDHETDENDAPVIEGNVEGVSDNNEFFVGQTGPNELRVIVTDAAQTGDAPNVTFTDGVYEDYGDSSDATGHTEVATLESQLSAGTNFVSVPAASGELDISEVVTQLGGEDNVDSIMTYDDGEWQSYNPAKLDDKQDFDAVQGGQGYIVTLNESAELEVNVNNVVGGSDYDEGGTPQATQLEEGWNLVGQWQEGAQTTGEALKSASDSVSAHTAIYGQAESSNGYRYVTVTDFEPGEAYWVFATDDTMYTESQAFGE